ncbi:hypothetical protein [Clostridium kluyveri]|uniref:Uncharacterized protein n=2 Tax=Clostridium kluyveri TaxID=1534 RepID=A5N7H3_CLOK5|nr:hypothetical protein [Clostridium kluyveri]EDK33254.1 Conserved hypothetical protein [Clostridium kluyveri DSM 555]BAH06160.1 hypothetical protein CKR_1109 [Clostridium kluyveri NBRC 12016]
MWQKSFLEVGGKNIIYREIYKKIFFINLFNRSKKRIIFSNKLQDIKVNLKNKRLCILVHGEEIYITYMDLPKMKRESLNRVVRNELKSRFKNMDNIMFSYEIVKHSKHSLGLIVFCMNWSNMNIAKVCDDKGGNIRGIMPIQFYIWSTYKDKLGKGNYIFTLIKEDTLYLMACEDDKVVFNNVFKNIIIKEEFLGILEEFKFKLNILIPKIKFSTIVFVDFLYKDIIKALYKNYTCKDLGSFSIK